MLLNPMSRQDLSDREQAIALIRHYWLDSAHQPDERYVAAVIAALTPRAPAQAKLDALREEVARLTKERDAAFAMSRCECSADEACANLVKLQAELAALKAQPTDVDALAALSQPDEARDAARYRHMRSSAQFLDRNGPGLYWYLPRFRDGSLAERLDAAIDAAMSKEQP
jgi:hypothetical protein